MNLLFIFACFLQNYGHLRKNKKMDPDGFLKTTPIESVWNLCIIALFICKNDGGSYWW